jgi:hypothetical protein
MRIAQDVKTNVGCDQKAGLNKFEWIPQKQAVNNWICAKLSSYNLYQEENCAQKQMDWIISKQSWSFQLNLQQNLSYFLSKNWYNRYPEEMRLKFYLMEKQFISRKMESDIEDNQKQTMISLSNNLDQSIYFEFNLSR